MKKKTGPPPGPCRVGNHADNPNNNRCDELAVAESRKYKQTNQNWEEMR